MNSESSQCSLIPGLFYKGIYICSLFNTQKRAYHINTKGGAWSYGYLYRYTAAIQDLVPFTPTQVLVWRQLVGPSHWPDRPQQRGIKCTVRKAMQPLPPAPVCTKPDTRTVCVCLERGVVSTRLKLDWMEPRPLKHTIDSNGMHIIILWRTFNWQFFPFFRGAPIPSLQVHKFRSL